jgi:hypothetical protein
MLNNVITMYAGQVEAESVGPPTFQHTKLDEADGSIRLLKVQTELDDTGMIQCEVWNDTTSAHYICLSYVWGSDEDRQAILINGRRLWIQKNLWDFLTMTRMKNASETFWIDAICIDQDSISERNHQVAQMGSIYKSAARIITWLGFNESIRHFFKVVYHLASQDPKDSKHARSIWYTNHNQNTRQGWLDFARDPYWTRAWITQELLLASYVTLHANDERLGPAELGPLRLLLPFLHGILEKADHKLKIKSSKVKQRILRTYMDIITQPSQQRRSSLNRTLSDLLVNYLPGRQCRIPRDRIYSLLSLASDGQAVDVNYSSSDEELFLHLLERLGHSICFCFLGYLVSFLNLESSNLSARTLDLVMKVPWGVCNHDLWSFMNTTAPEINEYHSDKSKRTFSCNLCYHNLLLPNDQMHLFCPYRLCHEARRQSRFSSVPHELHMFVETSGQDEGKSNLAVYDKAVPNNVAKWKVEVMKLEERTGEERKCPTFNFYLSLRSVMQLVEFLLPGNSGTCQNANGRRGAFRIFPSLEDAMNDDGRWAITETLDGMSENIISRKLNRRLLGSTAIVESSDSDSPEQ